MGGERPYRLVSFLGKPAKGRYKTTIYMNPADGEPREVETCFVVEALNQFLQPEEIVILATKEAWDAQGKDLQKKIGNKLEWRELPPGTKKQEIWEQFRILKDALRLPEEQSNRKVVLDITHGFRSQPFFAAGVVTFVQLVDEKPPEISIYYGAFEARDENNKTLIWDLTPLVDLISWSSNIMLFLKTGRGEGLASATETIGRALQKEWALGGKRGNPPNLKKLGDALDNFAKDLETVRTGSLILGKSQEKSSAQALLEAIASVDKNAIASIPPLSDVLDRIKHLASPLVTNARLSEPEGLKALQELARIYHKMGRYAEAASTIRETYINRYACDKSDCPGDSSFSAEHREAAEEAWRKADSNLAREIAQLRNDIEHAGYKEKPMLPNTIKRKIKELIDRLTKVIEELKGV